MATINASATISAAADGSNFSYTLTLNNASTSNSGIGTFWYAWVPGEDFMAASPISVTPPPGWTDNITHGTSTDGYAIQFLASNPTYDVQPGSSMTFSFVSAVHARRDQRKLGRPPGYTRQHVVRLSGRSI